MSRRKRSQAAISLFAFQDIITCVMGVMLLLTVLLCLQITLAGVQEFQPDKTASEVIAKARTLEEQLQSLQDDVAKNEQLLRSGALLDDEMLAKQVSQVNDDVTSLQQDLARAVQDQKQANQDVSRLRQLAKDRRGQLQQIEEIRQRNEQLQKALNALQSGDRIVYNGKQTPGKTCWLVEMRSASEYWAAELDKSQRPKQFRSIAELRTWMRSQSNVSFFLITRPSSVDAFEQLAAELRALKMTYGFDLLPEDRFALDPDTGAGIR